MHTYYRFLDKFHCEPKSWQELMEFSNFLEAEGSIRKFVTDYMKQE